MIDGYFYKKRIKEEIYRIEREEEARNATTKKEVKYDR